MLTYEEIEEAVNSIVPDYGVCEAALFGSYARGEQRADSDVDMVVELGRPLGFRRAQLIESLQESLGTHVDLIFGKDQLYGPVRQSFERDKVIVYEAR